MTLTEAFAHDEIFIDFSSEPMCSSNQICINVPIRFPTVTFRLLPSNGLTHIADRIRKENGFKPMHAMDEFTDATCDQDGWYEFFVDLNAHTDSHLDSCIDFIVVNSDSDDNEKFYAIELSEDEQIAIYNRLDEQCIKYLGKSCDALLTEAGKELLASHYSDSHKSRHPLQRGYNDGGR